ncbi:MAG: hypothetical protein EBS16_00825 [Betaproteobacteria bacterium]|nr:hypothetical protein [Betaproteobacteria bacterium]
MTHQLGISVSRLLNLGRFWRLPALVGAGALALGLWGCGQKGPLVLPGKDAGGPAASAAAAAPAASASASTSVSTPAGGLR